MRTIKRILAVALALLMSHDALAAVGTGTVWWIQPTAPSGNTAGAGFDTAATMDGTLSCTSATGNSPVCTSSNYTFVAGDATYWLYVQSGTNWTPGWYQIASVSGGAATLTATIGTALQVDNTKGSPYGHYQLNTVAGCATTASPTSGSWSIDYAKSDTRVINAVADLTIDATVNTKVTSASRTFGVNDIGNIVHITAGTSWTITTPFYEIVSVASGAATLDRSPSAAGNAKKGTWYYGAAASLGSATAGRSDSNLFIAGTNGSRFFIKNGSYSLAATTTSGSGSTTLPLIVEGYNTTPGDGPMGSNRPTITLGALVFTMGTNAEMYNVIASGTGANVLAGGTNSKFVNIKAVNPSTTAARNAINCASSNCFAINNEAISYRGPGIARGGASALLYGNYIHDSDKGINDTGGSIVTSVINNIIADNVTAGYSCGTGISQHYIFAGNTFYGAENNTGIALSIPTSMINPRIFNNIFYGFATGINSVDTSQTAYSDYNDYFNNTSDFGSAVTWQKGMHDLALNPTFASLGQYTGTTATTSGSVLTDSGANFANTTDNVDFCYIVSGTGITAGKYLITSHTSTTLTLDIAPGTSAVADKVYQTTYGHNFAIGTNLKAQGFPGVFPGALATGYLDMGADQRQETGSSGGTKGFTFAN